MPPERRLRSKNNNPPVPHEPLEVKWERGVKERSFLKDGTKIKDTEHVFLAMPQVRKWARSRRVPLNKVNPNMIRKARIQELRRVGNKVLAKCYYFVSWSEIREGVRRTLDDEQFDRIRKSVGQSELFADPNRLHIIHEDNIIDEGYVHRFEDKLWIPADGWYIRSEISYGEGGEITLGRNAIAGYNPDTAKHIYCVSCKDWRDWNDVEEYGEKDSDLSKKSEYERFLNAPIIRGMGWLKEKKFVKLKGHQRDWLFVGSQVLHDEVGKQGWPEFKPAVTGKLEDDDNIKWEAFRGCVETVVGMQDVGKCPVCDRKLLPDSQTFKKEEES
ncbi:hypothetical protein Moror_5529 [Moniliophthora roreri MCA 2997]|uniref:Uncharacterized protein n=1 Tax=Moniliophthora roreri (strain MCA 2997) TaxID=1381753 RepID=V2WMZ6_MONRO|nr:hypothetical protein Moror_5529 [Moniliophthora roreri MCA 2997]